MGAPVKHQITIAAANNLRRMATKPGYVVDLEKQVAPAAGPFDNAGGAFPFDVPSEAFTHHLRQLDELIAQAQHQVNSLRDLAQSIRAVAEGRVVEAVDPPPVHGAHPLNDGYTYEGCPGCHPHDPSIHEPPPPPEAITYGGSVPGLTFTASPEATAEEIEAEVIPPIVPDPLAYTAEELETQAAVSVPRSTPAMTWTCPVHDQWVEAVSRKGRTYRYCPIPDCGRLDIMGLPNAG